jgi:hypothetical protein
MSQKNSEKIEEIPCIKEWIFSLEGRGFSRDGILGYQFDKRLVLSTGGFLQKTMLFFYFTADIYENYTHSHFKNPYKKSTKHENTSLFMKTFRRM